MRAPRAPLARTIIAGTRRAAAFCLLALGACIPSAGHGRPSASTLIIGIDVGSAFVRDGRYDSSMDFAANYLYAHIRGLGGLDQPTAVFVGPIGGATTGDANAFQPLATFAPMSVAQIAAHLRKEYPARDEHVEFTPFFERVAALMTREKLVLSPLEVVLLTDGGPAAPAASGAADSHARIDLGALEYLSRSVTVRVLYPSTEVAARWEQSVPRRRVRLLAVDRDVMALWERHHRAGLAPQQQAVLWKWISDHVDVHVRRPGLLGATSVR